MAEVGGSEAAGAGVMSTPEATWPSLNDVGAELLFEKVLTSCDAASRGRIVLPKKAAVEHFACQDGKVGLTVHCEDTFGNEHTILHRFWSNSKSRMYLLEGLESVLRVYKVSPGDVLLFGRMPSGKMVVCARPPGPGDVQRSRRAVNGTGVATDKPAKVKQPSMPAVATRRQKRARLLERAASVDSESSQEGADYFQPRPDGIFRAVPPSSCSALEPQVLAHEHFWSATADVGGELYQAFFDTAASAFDAFVTAGHNLPDDLAAAAYAYEQEQQAAAAAAAEAAASAEPDELEAEDMAADGEAAEQLAMDGDGLAGGVGAADAEAKLAVASKSPPASSAVPDAAWYAADDAHLQATAERQVFADTEAPATAAATADRCALAPGNPTAELPAADSRTTATAGPQAAAAAPAPDRLAAAAGQGVELSFEPAGAVEVDVHQAVCTAAAVAADTQRQPLSGVMPLADAAREAPPAASVATGSEAAGDRGVPAAAAEVSENGIKPEPNSVGT